MLEVDCFFNTSDSISFLLATEKLNGDNYSQWHRSSKISLIAKNKLGFVTRKCAKPVENYSKYFNWQRCNNIVISWLLHSVGLQIAGSMMYCKRAEEIWKDLKDRYGVSNAPRLYQIQKELCSISQGNNSAASFFAQHKTLWDEYLSITNLPGCSCGNGSAFSKLLQDQQVMKFLM